MIVVLLIGSTGIYLPDYNMRGKPLESKFTLSKPTNDAAESCFVIFDALFVVNFWLLFLLMIF